MKGRMARFKFWSIISARRPTGLAVGGTVVLSGVLTAAFVITLGCGTTAKTVPGPAALSSSPTPVCGNSVLLSGPATAPAGAVIVPAGVDSGAYDAPHTTYYFATGTHTLGTGAFDQIQPGDGDTYVGAPGALLSGQWDNQSAFVGTATGVT